MLGALGGQSLSRVVEQIRIGCPGSLLETKKCRDGILYEKTNRKLYMGQKMR